MTPAEVCCAYLAAFSSEDPQQVASFVTGDFVNEHTSALGSGCVGRDEYIRRLPNFFESMPGLHYEVIEVIAEGSLIAVAYVLRATVNNRSVAVPGMMRFTVEDSLIAARVDYWDSLVFQRQAGLA